ncbi:hypothetical protein ML8HA_02624 [Lactococcus lactis]|nr:hypothetical protein [Lactococcus lactis]
MFIKNDKTSRVLRMNERLNKGEYLRKQEIKKSLIFLVKHLIGILSFYVNFILKQMREIVYDKTLNAYYLLSEPKRFTKKEVYALCKILIESRAFNHYEFNALIDKLLRQCNIKESKEVSKLIGNQRLHYIELKHGKDLINRIWEIATSVRNQNLISFEYQRQDGTEKKHHVKPVGIFFLSFTFIY